MKLTKRMFLQTSVWAVLSNVQKVYGQVFTINYAPPSSYLNWFQDKFGEVSWSASVARSWVRRTVRTVAYDMYTPNPGIVFVAMNGNDSNAGTEAAPLRTINKALRTKLAGTVLVKGGVYDSFDFRATDTAGGTLKSLIADGNVLIRTSGDDAGGLAWTQFSADIYTATLVTPNTVVRVLRTDSLDVHGEPLPIAQFASLTLLQSAASGWYFNSTLKQIYVKNVAIPTLVGRKLLKFVYQGTTAAQAQFSRVFIFGAKLYIQGFNFEGVYIWGLHNTVTPAEVFLSNCTLKYTPTHSVLLEGGRAYSSNIRVHRSKGDSFNYNHKYSGDIAEGVEIDCLSESPGDKETGIPGTAANCNGSSAHPNATVVRVNSTYRDSYGPALADCEGASVWNIGVKLINGTSPIGNNRWGQISAGINCNVWCEYMEVTGFDSGYRADIGRIYVNQALGTTSTYNNGQIVAFSR